ncbi:MAG: hypothetical protein EA424_25435 [Planctomycetaceae bacterium]|nr:MAG: hypothetical protein EA424_25435 [Planctomycetaceae bacterium]
MPIILSIRRQRPPADRDGPKSVGHRAGRSARNAREKVVRIAALRQTHPDDSISLSFQPAKVSRPVDCTYAAEIAWETDVWIAENPSHMIHFNGPKFLGPYEPRD